MKIIFFTNDLFGKDGWSRYAIDLISSLKKLDLEVLALVSKENPNSKINQLGILRKPLKYFTFPLRLVFDFLKIRKVIKKEKPDVIHFLVEPYLFFLPFIHFKKVKYFLTVHGTYSTIFFDDYKWKKRYFFVKNIIFFFSHKIFSHWIKVCFNKINKIISISNYTREEILKYSSFDLKDKIVTINNGIDLSLANITFPENKIKSIVFLGAVTERKGVLEALKALKVYKEKYSDNFVFNIIGSYQSNYYQDFVKEFNLEKNVKFLGRVNEEDKENFLKNADLFLMLSKVLEEGHFEGFGLVYLEANKYGAPAIGPNMGGPADAIKDGFSGFQVDVFNSQEVAEKIDLVLNKGEIKRENAFKWAKEHDIILKAQEIKELYNKEVENG